MAAEEACLLLRRVARPDDGLLGEEVGERPGSSGRRWIVDGIDGTRFFAAGRPTWGTLIALEGDGEIVLGVSSSPAQDRRWWASRGKALHRTVDDAFHRHPDPRLDRSRAERGSRHHAARAPCPCRARPAGHRTVGGRPSPRSTVAPRHSGRRGRGGCFHLVLRGRLGPRRAVDPRRGSRWTIQRSPGRQPHGHPHRHLLQRCAARGGPRRAGQRLRRGRSSHSRRRAVSQERRMLDRRRWSASSREVSRQP